MFQQMMRTLIFSLIVLESVLMGILISIVGLKDKTPVVPGEVADTAPMITLEKTECYGRCPVYKLMIYDDGQALYQGISHVDKIGEYQQQLPADTIASLIQHFEQSGFWSLKDEYVADVTDLPVTYLSFQYQGKHKKIKNLIQAPAELTALENRIAALGESPGWKMRGS